MPRIELERGYPFSGARTKWQNPIPANFFDPIVWSLTAFYSGLSFRMTVPGVNLQAAGCRAGDVLFVTESLEGPTWANTILNFTLPDEFTCSVAEPTSLTGVHVKISPGLHHTLQSLAQIIDARHLYALTLHWATLWTEVPFNDFNDDETGDIYTIDPPSGGRLNSLINSWKPPPDDPEAPNPWKNMNPRPEI